jgi:hypothetical protein
MRTWVEAGMGDRLGTIALTVSIVVLNALRETVKLRMIDPFKKSGKGGKVSPLWAFSAPPVKAARSGVRLPRNIW